MSDLIPLSVPSIKGNEHTYIKECLDTEWVSSAGKYVTMFEEKICGYTGAQHAIASVNGTSALHIALKVVGVLPNDEVIVPTVTFIAPINAVRYLDAFPVFMDCDDYYNIDIGKTLEFLNVETIFTNGCTYNKLTGRRISAIIPVHVFGNAVALEQLVNECSVRNIKIVEDATESLGTFYKQNGKRGKHTGTVGDIGCFSFNGNKIITTGGGGMIVTNNPLFADRSRYLTTQAKDDDVRYIHGEIGYNYRLTNLQAALGVAQLERIEDFLRAKARNYSKYKKEIAQIKGLRLAETPAYAENNLWMYALQIDKIVYGRDRENLMLHFAANQVQSRPLWYLNHLQKSYLKCQHYKISKAVELLDLTLNIPCSVNLKDEEIEKVLSLLRN